MLFLNFSTCLYFSLLPLLLRPNSNKSESWPSCILHLGPLLLAHLFYLLTYNISESWPCILHLGPVTFTYQLYLHFIFVDGSVLSHSFRPQWKKLVPYIPLLSTYCCHRPSRHPVLRHKYASLEMYDANCLEVADDVINSGIRIPRTHSKIRKWQWQ
jgi:hypothetical protein